MPPMARAWFCAFEHWRHAGLKHQPLARTIAASVDWQSSPQRIARPLARGSFIFNAGPPFVENGVIMVRDGIQKHTVMPAFLLLIGFEFYGLATFGSSSRERQSSRAQTGIDEERPGSLISAFPVGVPRDASYNSRCLPLTGLRPPFLWGPRRIAPARRDVR